MRAGTILVLLALILLFAAFGIQVFGWILAFILGTLLLAILAVAVGLWAIKRRMRRKLEELGVAMEQHLRRTQAASGRDDAIEVEGTVRRPRDGADAPDEPSTDRP